MFVDPACRWLIADLNMRNYKPGTNEPADATGGQTDIGHITDAMGYAVWHLFPLRLELDYRRQRITTRA